MTSIKLRSLDKFTFSSGCNSFVHCWVGVFLAAFDASVSRLRLLIALCWAMPGAGHRNPCNSVFSPQIFINLSRQDSVSAGICQNIWRNRASHIADINQFSSLEVNRAMPTCPCQEWVNLSWWIWSSWTYCLFPDTSLFILLNRRVKVVNSKRDHRHPATASKCCTRTDHSIMAS